MSTINKSYILKRKITNIHIPVFFCLETNKTKLVYFVINCDENKKKLKKSQKCEKRSMHDTQLVFISVRCNIYISRYASHCILFCLATFG